MLGFAVGPLLWAPLSELYGRQLVHAISFGGLSVFNAGAAAAQNIQTLIILRFFAGVFGAAPFTNAGAIVADIFMADQRGLAITVFAVAPFLGPVLGPIIGGFLGETQGWRWVEGLMAILSGTFWIVGMVFVPETYAPVLLRRRAARLSQATGRVYRSRIDLEKGGESSARKAFRTAILRPWALLFLEPIVLLLSIYMSIVYGTLYLLFAAYPIVYQELRGWSEGVGGLAFLGIAVGMILALLYGFVENIRYRHVVGTAPSSPPAPETRLIPAMIGGPAIPIALFWFAWTNGPSVHWIVSVIAGAPFGFGMVLIFVSIKNYLVDSYTTYAASALAGGVILRSFFAAAFPLFTQYMFRNLGVHWASSIPAFLSLICTPLPFVFYAFGPKIREKSRYTSPVADFGGSEHLARVKKNL